MLLLRDDIEKMTEKSGQALRWPTLRSPSPAKPSSEQDPARTVFEEELQAEDCAKDPDEKAKEHGQS